MVRGLLLLIFFSFSNILFGQDFQWGYQTVESSNATEPTAINSVVTDHLGNVYATGFFSNTCDFDNSVNSYFLTCPDNQQHGFVIKLDKNRNFIWAKQIVSSGDIGTGNSIILDKNENVIVTGFASGFQIDLDPDPIKQYIFTSNSSTGGGYIIKLDQNGNFINGSFTQDFFTKESTVDSQNNIITIGSKNGALFVMKSDTNLNIIWQKSISGNNIFSRAIACDNHDNVILTGNFEYKMSFGDQVYYSSSSSSGSDNTDFICKLANDGSDIWYQQLGTTAGELGSAEDKSLLVDNFNNIYFNTSYVDDFTVMFNGKAITLPHDFGEESALFKIDENGNYIWSVPIYGQERQEIKSLGFNSIGDIYIYLFNNGKASVKDTSNASYQIESQPILLKLNNNGSYISLIYVPPGGISLSIDLEDNILIGGRLINEQHDFDPSPTSSYLMSAFRGCGYILKLGPCDSLMPNGDSNQNFCASENPTINNLSPNSNSIKWYDSLTTTTQLSASASLVNGQTYYASKKIGSCSESPRLPVNITINQNPVTPIAGNQIFCESENATLFDLGVTGQNVKFYDALTGGNLLPTTTLLMNDTNYYASQTSNSCESNRITIKTTVIPSTIPTATSSQTFCIQQNPLISNLPIAGQNIKWYDTQTSGNEITNTTALQDGVTYYASQTLNGCESLRVPVAIQIQNTPVPTGNNPQPFCVSQNPTINDIVVSGSNIKWYDSSNGNTILSSTTLLTDGTTYYSTQTVNGCESVNRLAVTTSLITSLNANDYSATLCDVGNDGTENTDLSGFNSFLLSSTGNTFTYYTSLNSAENEITADQINTNYGLTLGLNSIYVRINSSNGCYQIVQLLLTLVNEPVINIPDELILCERANITVNAGVGFDSYLWSTSQKKQMISINQPGNYSVTVTKNHGDTICSVSKDFTVTLSNAATIESVETEDWTDNQNKIIVNTTGKGNYEYSLDGINFQDSNIFTGLQSDNYTVYVKDKNNCGITTKSPVYLLNYVKFFTPNGDGFNDLWSVKFSQFEENFEVQIYDRYGKLMKSMLKTESWDGTYNGYSMPADDYWFHITRNDGQIYKGHFSLKR